MTTACVSRTEDRSGQKNSERSMMKSLARKVPDWINDPQSYQADGPKKSYRTVFISDVHLGSPAAVRSWVFCIRLSTWAASLRGRFGP